MADPLKKKIELDLSEEKEKKRIFPQKKLALIGGVLSLVVFFLTFFLVLPLFRLKNNFYFLAAEAKGIYASFQAQDLNQTVSKLAATKEEFKKVKANYRKLIWLQFLPFLGRYYRDGKHLIAGGQYLLDSADIALESLQPYADLFGLEGEEGEERKEMTTEERLMLALNTLDKIQPNLDRIGEKLALAQKEIDQIDPRRYPETLFGKKIRPRVVSLIETIDNTAQAATEIKPVVSLLKPLLGIPEKKKYLLLFQNDAELRPTGGFLTAYAILTVENGRFQPLGSYDIYSLDARFGNRLAAPEPIKNYHKNVFYWHLRDMNLSPDFAKSMEVFWEHYQKVGSTDIDGIIAVDTQLLVDFLEVLGPIGVANWGSFSAAIDERCDCPQVFYELERYADKPVGELRTERKAIIGPLMHSILLHIMQSPRRKWPEFFNVLFTNIQEKHLLFYFFDEEIQKAVEAMNAAGRIKDYDGDYLHINDCNFAGAKSNMFIKENVIQEIEIAADGTVVKTLIIDYKNPAPPSNCNLEAGELCLNGLYRNWVRIYVPKGSELLEARGSEVEVKTYEDLGKTVFEAFYGNQAPLRPLGKAQLKFKYKLPFKIKEKENYRLLIQKQPGTYGYEYLVKLNGKEETFELKSDREIKL